jgi:hypothetical protein
LHVLINTLLIATHQPPSTWKLCTWGSSLGPPF